MQAHQSLGRSSRGRFSVNALLMVCLFLTASMVYGQNDTAARLDQLLADNRAIDLARVLQSGSINEEQKLDWLKRRAAEGHVIAQYELANQLRNQNPVEAINWYAKARLRRILDAAECKDERRAEGIGLLIDVGYQALQELATKNEGLFASAIEKALDDDLARAAHVPPYWICAPGNSKADETSLLPTDQRTKKREEARRFLATRGQVRALEARLNANLNPERFEISEIPARLWGDEVGNSMSWIDNNVVLFSAYDKPRIGQRNLYSWNVTNGQVRLVAENAGRPCMYKGFVSYVVTRNDIWYYRQGKFGEEVEIVYPRPLYPDYAIFRCRLVRRADLPGRWPEQPLDSGGVLKFPSSRADWQRVPMKFYPEGSSVAIDLPFFRTEMLSDQSAHYSEYLQASWIIRHDGFAGSQDRGRIWVIHSDGRVDTIDIPPGPWISHLGNYPIKEGFAKLS